MRKIGEKKSVKKIQSKEKNEKKQLEKNIHSAIKGQNFDSNKSGSSGKDGKKTCEKNEILDIKKQYLKSNGFCKVTFTLPKEAAPGAQTVTMVGDFNNWNLTDTQMKKLGSGDFKVTLKLSRDREYRFRYLIDGSRWENDWNADKYVPNPHGCDDSLVIV